MADQAVLILDLRDDRSPRVAGTLTGPIGDLDATRGWAFVADTERVTIYRVR